MEFGASATHPGFGLRREIDRIVGDPFTRTPRDRRRSAPAPSMEMQETDGELTVKVALPDASVAGVDIGVHDGVLTVCERTQPAEEAHDQLHGAGERRESAFQQSVQLPTDADELGIVSQVDGGVLTVRIPKVRAAARRRNAERTQPAASPATMPSVTMPE